MRLAGRNVVITGAASGCGLATSLLFAREGARVACVDNDVEMGEAAAARIRDEGGEAIFIEADVADEQAARRMAAACMAWQPKIHALFNNAGMLIRAQFEDVSLADWNRQIAVNLTAPFFCSQLLLPALKAAGGASIIHHGSIDGIQGNPSIVAYSAAKGGMMPLTHMMAFWLGRDGIRVNCINSGAIMRSDQGIPIHLGERHRERMPMRDGMRLATPLGRPGTVEEVAAAALFLASDESSYMSGSVLTLDGGRTGITPGTF